MDGNDTFLLFIFNVTSLDALQAPLIINLCFGLPANIWVLWLIVTRPGDKASEIFSLNLSICEIAICVANFTNVMLQNYPRRYLFTISIFFSGVVFAGRPLFMSSVCLERYLAVVHPTIFQRYKPLRYKVAGAGICWLIVLVSCMTYTLVPLSAMDYVAFGMVITFGAVQVFCSVKTLVALKRPSPGERNQDREGMNTMKLKAFKIIMIIMVSTAVSYLPFLISVVLTHFLPEKQAFESMLITTYIAVFSGFVQPLLYIHRSGKLSCRRAP